MAAVAPAAAAPAAAMPATEVGTRQLRTVPLTDFGNGGYLSEVNASGQVLGALFDANHERQPVLWQDYDSPVALGIPDGYEQALNNRGHVAGEGDSGGAWLWRPSGVTYLGRSVWVDDLNDRDQVVGEFMTSPSSAFLWRNGQFTELGAPAGMGSYATKVNNRGEVVGYQVNEDWSVRRGVIWRGGKTAVLNGPDGAAMQPMDLNDRGQVLGFSVDAASGLEHPVLWQGGRSTDLLRVGPSEEGWANDINNRGDVVGRADSRAVMWHDGSLIDLGLNGDAVRINDRGDIAGTVTTSTPDDTLTVRVFRWRAGHVLYSAPVIGHEVGVGVVGLDELGRIVGRISDDEGHTELVAWVAT